MKARQRAPGPLAIPGGLESASSLNASGIATKIDRTWNWGRGTPAERIPSAAAGRILAHELPSPDNLSCIFYMRVSPDVWTGFSRIELSMVRKAMQDGRKSPCSCSGQENWGIFRTDNILARNRPDPVLLSHPLHMRLLCTDGQRSNSTMHPVEFPLGLHEQVVPFDPQRIGGSENPSTGGVDASNALYSLVGETTSAHREGLQ